MYKESDLYFENWFLNPVTKISFVKIVHSEAHNIFLM